MLMKKLLLSSVFALFAGIASFAQGTDDFATLTANTSYTHRETAAGWVGENCAVLSGGAQDSNPVFSGISGSSDVKALCMNGKTSAVGSITSPVLSNGCGTLTLKYGCFYKETKGVSFQVAVKQNGAVVAEWTVENAGVVKGTAYTFEQEVNVAGDFQIVMTNNSPSNKAENMDRYAVWNIAWTEYAGGDVPPVTVDVPVITPEGGAFTEAQTVTITAAEGLTAYYTLDGSSPSAQSTRYEAPFTVAETTTIKAVAVDADGNQSKVVSATISILPVYTTIAEMKAAATATKETVVYRFEELLVTGAAGTSVYVTDGTNGFLFYGTASSFKVGDKISGSVQGDLYLYNNLTEMASVKYDEVTVVSSGNEVVPTVLTLSELNAAGAGKKYESMLVRFEHVAFAAATLTSKNVSLCDEEGEDLTLRDNFNVLADVEFDTDAYYNVTAMVALYKETVQVYPLSADDVELITELLKPVQGWEKDTIVAASDAAVIYENKYTTNSDGAVTYSSSNPAVAAIDAEGNITLGGAFGMAVIKAETAETTKYLAASSSFKLFVLSGGNGSSLENPYQVIDVIYNFSAGTEKVWVKGYIVGYVDGQVISSGAKYEAPETSPTNILIANTPEETDYTQCLPIQLPKGVVRDGLDLSVHTDYLKHEVWVYGSLEKYFGVPGVKNTSDFSLDGLKSDIVRIEADAVQKEIFNVLGQRVASMDKAGIYIVNGKKVLVK